MRVKAVDSVTPGLCVLPGQRRPLTLAHDWSVIDGGMSRQFGVSSSDPWSSVGM